MPAKLKERIEQTRRFINSGVWELEPESLTRVRRAGLRALRVIMLVIRGFKEDQCPVHAAALTFISVMSLVPFLVILFAVAKGFGFEKASESLLQKTANMPEAFQNAVTTIIRTVESASAGAIGSIGTVLFLWVAIKMLSSVEDTFNLVWGVKTPRTLLDKIRNYIVVIFAVPILLLIATAAVPVLVGFADKLSWASPVLSLVPVLIMSLAFTMMYLFLPDTKVQFSAAFSGAFVSALLAVLFQFAMIRLGIGVSKYNKIYGALAAIPIFLFWMQTSWMILLMGAEVAFSVQNAGTYARERLAVNPSARSRLCLAFALMKKITVAFEKDQGPFLVLDWAINQRIPVRLVRDVLHILSTNGLITEAVASPGGYTLLRDPAHISARIIADAILNEGADPAELGLKEDFPMFGKITDESFQTLEKQLLKSF